MIHIVGFIAFIKDSSVAPPFATTKTIMIFLLVTKIVLPIKKGVKRDNVNVFVSFLYFKYSIKKSWFEYKRFDLKNVVSW